MATSASQLLRSVAARAVPTVRARTFTSSPLRLNAPVKVPIALIAELRKHNPVALSKAKEALSASNNSVAAALGWLEADLAKAGAKKAAKVGSRETKEGLIGVAVMGTRAAMVEVRCETDFVGRNDVFRNLVEGLCSTTAFLDIPAPSPSTAALDPILSFPVEELLTAPVIPVDPKPHLLDGSQETLPPPAPQTVSQAITAAITQTGENIQLRRAMSFSSPISPSDSSAPFLLPGVYVHGSIKAGGNEGKVGGMVILGIKSSSSSDIFRRLAGGDPLGGELQKMARNLARQAVGFPTEGVSAPSGVEAVADGEVSPYLLDQPFMMFQGEQRPVKEVLAEWGKERDLELEVVGLRRWSVGDDA